jgi:hypothetical protein
MCTWGSRKTRRRKCLACLVPRVNSDDELAPTGDATEEHSQAARAALEKARNTREQVASLQNAGPTDELRVRSPSHEAWDANSLPNRSWWEDPP